MEILFELNTSIYLKIDDFLLVGGVYLHSFIIPDALQLCRCYRSQNIDISYV